jgi:hypothetical protein
MAYNPGPRPSPQGGSDDLNIGGSLGDTSRSAFQSHKTRFSVDPSGLRKLNTEFKKLNDQVKDFTKNVGAALSAAQRFNTVAGGMGFGGGGVGTSTEIVSSTGESTDAGGVSIPTAPLTRGKRMSNYLRTATGVGNVNPGAEAIRMTSELVAGLVGASSANIKGRAEYTLEADRTGLLMRQMYGGTQLEYQSKWRQPLTSRMLGPGGIAPMMNLQTTMGINPSSMAAGVEGIRVASGFGYSTEDATRMITAMAQPGSSNLMTMMLGAGMYGPGGKARDPMDVIRNVVTRMGLTNEAMVQGAFQPGSMTRANLSRTGLPTDMQNLVLQYAQENIEYKKRGGKGMYDPSKESDRAIMGIEGRDEYAMEREKTGRAEMDRAENFYRRQVDNYADLERNTRKMVGLLESIENRLSGLIGLQTTWTGAPSTRIVGGAARLGGTMAQIGGAMMIGSGGSMTVPGALLMGLGTILGAIGDPEDTEPENITQPGMDSGFQSKLRAMAQAAQDEGHHLTLTSGVRNGAEQSDIFFKRMRLDPNGKTVYKGRRYSLKSGNDPATGKPWAHVAPPGGSLHGVGLAADLGPRSAYPWIKANAARFGLRTASDEPWHVSPAGMTMAKYKQTHPHWSQTVAGGQTGSRANARTAVSYDDIHGMTKDLGIPASIKAIESSSAARMSGGVGDDGGGGGGAFITIAPVIHLNGSGNDAEDAQRLAQRVIHMIETAEAVRSLRRS